MGEGFRRDGRKLSTTLDGTRSRRGSVGMRTKEGVNQSLRPRPRFQDGSLRMQKCKIPYNRSSGRRQILNLDIPFGPRFSSLSVPLVLSNLIPCISLVFLLLVSWHSLVLSIRTPLAEASVYLKIRGAPISRAPD